MSHPRVEELDDSDPDEMDISEIASSMSGTPHMQAAATTPNASLMHPASVPARSLPSKGGYDKEKIQSWQCLYPLYFDAGRTRSEGRRVGKEMAVQNPLARDIVEGVAKLGLQVAFEPGKCHPKDWANPGRVKVHIKDEQTSRTNGNFGGVEGKHHLYLKVAEYLKANPTTEDAPLKLQIPGLPTPTEPLPPPAVPRGWKMSTVLPLHSAAVTGGGVSENMFQDMMAQMGGGQAGQDRDASPAGGKKKKDKKIKG